MTRVPEKPSLDGLEARWSERWDADGTYRFDRTKAREEIYSIDTPPPTVSGSLHMGSVFGYAQTDSIVRYRRVRGAHGVYPLGVDAHAELEDGEQRGATHRVRFGGLDGESDIVIETTRPELIPACVALVAHPDDARFRDRFSGEVTTPLFGVRVPVVAHHLADPEKGAGIAMLCTFGDVTHVAWCPELRLPPRSVMGRDGRLAPDPPARDARD